MYAMVRMQVKTKKYPMKVLVLVSVRILSKNSL